jgi:Domain of Unknown Function (DUF930)
MLRSVSGRIHHLMQQTLEKRRGSFGAGLFASVALHVAVAALVLFRLPPSPPEPEKEETVKVEMVPEPEKKPEQKPAPEAKPKAEAKPQAEVKPAAQKAGEEKPATPAKAEQRPAEEQAETRKVLPQGFESAANEGGKEAGGDRPSEPEKRPEAEPRADRAAPADENKVTEEAKLQIQKPDAVPDETPKAAKLPELELPESERASQILNEGEAAIETVPKPMSKPRQKPVDAKPANPQQFASADNKSADAKPQRPPSEMKAASELYSANALSDPRVRQALGKLPKERRVVQICMVETLEQIRRARPDTLPEGLFFDPPKGTPLSGPVLNGEGSAYRSGGAWYDVDFHCTVNEKADAITAFSFSIGGAVPKGQWKARRLPVN